MCVPMGVDFAFLTPCVCRPNSPLYWLSTRSYTTLGFQMDSAPKKEGISNSMRAKLIAEASTGLDSNQKQTNVILYIILGVAVLVVLGGAGVFY